MDLRHMRHFVAVAEELHFGNAARRLNMAQPPLSQSIKRLELELGVDLFDRTRRSVELTDAGAVLLEEARRTLMQADLARKLTQRAANRAMEVQVSFVGPALYRVLPSLLIAYRQAKPEANVRLFERTSPDQIAGLAAGDFEIAFTTSAIGEAADCETLLVEEAPFVVAVPGDWDVARQETISLAQLAELPFIRTPSKYHVHSESFAMFKNAGLMPMVVQEATQTNTTLSLVGASLGCGMVTASAAFVQPRNVKLLPISDASLAHSYWQLLMVWRPMQLSPAAATFVATVRDYIDANPHLVARQTPAEALAMISDRNGA